MRMLLALLLVTSGLAACNDEPAQTAASGNAEESPERQDDRARFHGVGQEPGWFIDLTENGEITVEYDYAQKRAVFPFPREVEGKALRYAAQTDTDRLELTITSTSCSDPMNGRRYPQTVTAVINGERLKGCGSWNRGEGEEEK